jgi:hypothetical protein
MSKETQKERKHQTKGKKSMERPSNQYYYQYKQVKAREIHSVHHRRREFP